MCDLGSTPLEPYIKISQKRVTPLRAPGHLDQQGPIEPALEQHVSRRFWQLTPDRIRQPLDIAHSP
eukprot:9218307-Alexandrium_andersonii.AAC.1